MQPAAAHWLLLQRGVRPVLCFSDGFRRVPVMCHASYARQLLHQSWFSRNTQIAVARVAATTQVKTAAGTLHAFNHAPVGYLRMPQQQQGRCITPRLAAAFFHTCTGELLVRSSGSARNGGEQGFYTATLPSSGADKQLRLENIRLLKEQELQRLQWLEKVARRRDWLHKQQVQHELQQLFYKAEEGLLNSAAELPAQVLDKVLSPLLRQLYAAAAAAGQKQPEASTLLQRLSQDIIALCSRSKRGESLGESSGSSSSTCRQREGSTSKQSPSSTNEGSGNSSTNSRTSNTGTTNNDGGGESTRDPRGPGHSAAPGNSTRRVPLGFEAFYPKEALKQSEGSSSSNSNSGSSRLPFVPPTGGALQHLLLRMCIWLGIWVFALSLLSRVVEPQLSLQEFLSSYVARGLVEKVVVVGDRGRCTAVVRAPPTPEQLQAMEQQQQHQVMLYLQQQHQVQQQVQQAMAVQQYQQQQQEQRNDTQQQAQQQYQFSVLPPLQPPKLTDMLTKKHIVRFKTGLTPESFIEKMEHFQASLGIHPKDFLPIYVEEGWNLSLGDLVASAFFFLIMATIARDFLMGGGVNRGGSASGLNRLLGNSSSKRARIKPDTVKVRFADVAGLHEAKREITEFVSFLKNPTAFQKMGAKLPKGALLVGPPGTGKTLLAKAVAGEAGVPFFSISGSDFVELFVGVGASRVRELFDEARKAAPSIIWIDEIDSVGASRSTQFANSEREQTLNQLLVEMDGFSPHESVVVLAGTNREDLLDAALKRAGRFDRRVVINRPDVKERAEIFKVHLQPLKLSPRVDSNALAERMAALTPGMVGADIANICNEAAIYAARRRTKRGIEQRDFELAVERIIAGLPSNTKNLMSEKQKKTIALHEAGHAVAGWFLKHADVVLKLTIIPRDSGAMGFSQQMPPPVELYEKDALLDRIAVCLAGRAAEELFMGCISSGAVDDIEKATHLARLIIMQLGMNPKVGLVNLKRTRQNPQDPYQFFSDATAQLVDDEVRNLISAQYERVKDLLREKEKEMNALSALLLEKETLTFADLQECLGKRPFPPDAQLAAYINALPTKVSIVEKEVSGAGRISGDLRSTSTPTSGARNAGDEAVSAAGKNEGTDGNSTQQQVQKNARTKDAEETDDDEENTNARKKKEKGKSGNGGDDDDDDDDDDRNGNNSTRGPRRRKLFGGDDDSCLPELLRKNLKPNTPTPSAAAKETDLSHTQ